MRAKANGMRLLFLGFLLIMLVGCNAPNKTSTKYELSFGIAGKNGIAEFKDEFVYGERFAFELEGDKAFETPHLRILMIKHVDDVERIIAEGENTIDPAWSWFYYPLKRRGVGVYTIKVFDADDNLLGEESFSVVE